MKLGSDKELLLRNMMNAPGGDPVYILDMLYEVVVGDVWRDWLTPQNDNFSDALALLGQSWNKVLNLVAISHPGELRGDPVVIERMTTLREKLKTMYEMEEIKPAREKPGRVWDNHNSDMSELSPAQIGGNSRPYRISVLKRDAPEIAQRVINKEISAAEGWRQAGKEPKRRAIAMDDPSSAAQTILDHMDKSAIAELLAILAEAIAQRE